MFEVDIGQAGIATEQKEVADDFEPFHGEYLVREAVQFFVGQVASVHLLEMEFVARQRIVFSTSRSNSLRATWSSVAASASSSNCSSAGSSCAATGRNR